MYLKYVFITSALLLALMIVFFKLFLQKKKYNETTIKYLHALIWVFAFYILTAFLLVFFVKDYTNKVLIFLFAVSPFIIGKFTVYKKENFYSFIQILCAIISGVFVYLV